MTEEEKIFAGQLFCPGDPALKAIKLRAHKLSQRYSQLAEDQAADCAEILSQLVGKMGKGCFFQGSRSFSTTARIRPSAMRCSATITSPFRTMQK